MDDEDEGSNYPRRTFVMDGAPVGFGMQAEARMVSPVISPQRQQRQAEEEYGDGDNEYFDEDEYEGDDGEYDDDDDEGIDPGGQIDTAVVGDEENVPKMPEGFYSNVDSFLSRPPPKVKGAGKKSRAKEKLDEKITKSASLPVLVSSSQQQKPVPKIRAESKIDTGRVKGPGKKKKKGGASGQQQGGGALDMSLLQQAFRYVDKVQQEALHDDLLGGGGEVMEERLVTSKKSGSAPLATRQQAGDKRGGRQAAGIAAGQHQQHHQQHHHHHTSSSRLVSKEEGGEPYGRGDRQQQQKPKGSGGNMAKRLRNKTKGSGGGASGGFDTTMQQEGVVSRNAVDFDALVANFEQGLTLHKLRAELDESRASMERSQKAMQNISREASSKMKL